MQLPEQRIFHCQAAQELLRIALSHPQIGRDELLELLGGVEQLGAELTPNQATTRIVTFSDGRSALQYVQWLDPQPHQNNDPTNLFRGLSYGLENKVVMVTGGAGDIGSEIVRRLVVEAGAKVIIADLESTRSSAEENIRRLENLGYSTPADPRAAFVPLDLTKTRSIKDAVRDSLSFGPIYSVVHNAMIFPFRALEEYKEKDYQKFRQAQKVGIEGPMRLTNEFVKRCPEFTTEQGSLVYVSSIVALQAEPFATAYSVVKSGQIDLMRSQALELAPRGISASAIILGHTWAKNHAQRAAAERKTREQFEASAGSIQSTLIKRFIEPWEVARLVMFLASPFGKCATGCVSEFTAGAPQTNPAYYSGQESAAIAVGAGDLFKS